MSSQRPPLVALVGPTAAGKSEAGPAMAERLGAEIVSVDSMLVYRGMDVGTAKPSLEDRARVRHHLIDFVDPSESFSVARYQTQARRALADIAVRGRTAMLVGGSGLYFRAIVDELRFPGTDAPTRAQLELEAATVGAAPLHRRLAAMDPVAASKIEPRNVRRTVRALEVAAITGREFSTFAASWEAYPDRRVRAAGISMDRSTFDARVRARVNAMLDRGFVDEVRGLVARGLGGWLTATQAIGYAELAGHLQGWITLHEAVEGTVQRTKNLARRQMAWFRRDPRIRWFEAGFDGAAGLVDDIWAYLEAA